ncbi:MraY family glycosyltransferase [Gammaproteobacteria bacterium]|nr:MraY family glycosyltransferase [Gammaproteobacteria bacterium]
MSSFWIAAISGCVVTALLLPLLMRYADVLGLIAEPNHRTTHKHSTPQVGGVAIYAGVLLALVLYDHSGHLLTLPLVASCGLLMVVGVLDDRFSLPPSRKLAAQVLTGLMMALWGDSIVTTLGQLLSEHEIQTNTWAVPLTVLGAVGVINAINMSDGMDGLAASMMLLTLVLLIGLYAHAGLFADAGVVVLFALPLAVFLFRNLRIGNRPAQVFLGDGGSLWLGLAVCWFLVSASQGPGRVIDPVQTLWLIAVPLIDAVSVMLRRFAEGKSPFTPDQGHYHHILRMLGFSVRASLLIALATALVLALFGLISPQFGLPQRYSFALFVLMFLVYLIVSSAVSWHRHRGVRL